MAVSDRIVVMCNAGIAANGHPRDLYERPPSAFVAGFMGEANILDGVLESVAAGSGRIAVGTARIEIPVADLAPGPVKVIARPGALWITSAGQGNAGSAFAGRVESSIYLGAHQETVVATVWGRLLVFGPAGTALPRGADVVVRIDPERCTVVRD